MDFTERMLERNRTRSTKCDNKEGVRENKESQTSAPLKEVHRNTVTTIASTSVDIKKNYSGSNKVTIETTVTMRKFPKRKSNQSKEDMVNDDETTCTEGESESTDEKENDDSQSAKCRLRQDTKSRLQRLGVLYSDDPSRLTSPIHRAEERFLVEEEEEEVQPSVQQSCKSSARSARLAALAETINHWEDDIRHHPVGEESQGFTRSVSNQRLLYNYNNTDRSTSPTKSSCDVFNNTAPSPNKSPTKETSQVKPRSPAKASSPIKARYGSPIQMGTTGTKLKGNTVPPQEEDVVIPTMGVKQLRSVSPRKMTATPPIGSVLDRASRYEESTSPPKRCRDPAELPLAERMALFERNASGAVLPKGPFAMPVPAKKLQSRNEVPKGFNLADAQRVKPCSQSSSHLNPGSSSSLHDRLAMFERQDDNSGKDHMKEILSERQKEIEMLKHRWDRHKEMTEPNEEDFRPSAPPQYPPPAPPMPCPPQHFEYDRRLSGFYEDKEQKCQISPPQEKPEAAYPVLKEVKKIKLSPPKPGCLCPSLSDMETESEVHESDPEHSDNNRSSSSETSIESDMHSLGQDIVKLSRSNLKRDWPPSDHSESDENEMNEIDNFLDEALNDSSDEPTPPKRTSYPQHMGTVQSTSFEYSRSAGHPVEPSQPLFHTVSFYRKQQNMTLKPPSPVKHIQIDPSISSTDDSIDQMEEELDRELKLVEQKIETLQQELKIQQTYISQASQALNLCTSTIEFSGSTEQLEFEKHLLLASKRRQGIMQEIQRLRVEQTLRPNAPGNKTLTERGSLTLSNITLPLKMDNIHHAAKDDQCYYLVCLVHSGERVLCTDVMCAPRSLHNHNKLTFPNTLRFDGLYSDFKVTLEVYTMTARNKELIPHDIKYHINTNKKDASKLKLTPRKGKGDSKLLMPSVQSPGGPSAVRTSAFTMAGYVIFSLREIHRKQFTLNKVAYTSVLEGSMQLKIDTEMSVDVVYRGFLTMFEDVSGLGAWHRRWCLLHGDKLSYWKYPDDERKKIALDTIELSSCTTSKVDVVPRDVCARPNTFLLETTRPVRSTDIDSLVLIRNENKTTIRHLLSADTKEDRIEWCHHLNKALALMRAWGVSTQK